MPKTISSANKSAIGTLARQVKQLQMSKIGKYQENYEYCQIVGGEGTNWSQDQPIIFAANNFLEDAPIFIGKYDDTTHIGHDIPSHVVKTQWAKRTPAGSGSKFPEHDYWVHSNDDHVSTTAYKAISTTLNINIEAPALAGNHVYWVRIDVFKPKKTLLHSNVRKLSLPMNVQALNGMASAEMSSRNRFHKDYFTVIYSKWIKLSHTLPAEDHKSIEKFCKIYLKFPQRSSTEKLNLHSEVETVNGTVQETFTSNMPQDEVYWVMLSTNQTSHDSMPVRAEMTRVIRYRDANGVSS